MTLQQLKYATGLARYASFNEAASRLFISQPSLSNAIGDLENEIGILIFARTRKGISVTPEGAEFLGYARQVLEQSELIESRYCNAKPPKRLFSVSTQHYAFAVNAFAETLKALAFDEYECTLRETKTHEIIEDVKNLRSEIGILYLNESNSRFLSKLFRDGRLLFTPILKAKPHVFISARHPLAVKRKVRLSDLEDYPFLSFEQGEYNSFHFSEEILSALSRKKTIKVSDRATLFNLLIGLEGYTISTGILTTDLNGNNIVPVPLDIEDIITVGYITHRSLKRTFAGEKFLENLKKICGGKKGSAKDKPIA